MKIRKTLCTISLFLHIVAFLVLSWPLKAGNERRDLLKRREVVALDSLPSERYFALHGALDNFFVRVKIDKEASVAFLGGSITAGEGWRNKVMRYLEQAYPDTKFTFLNAGVPSLGSVPHAFRLERDVFDKGPVDLLFVESAVNDLANATPPDHQRRALEGIVRQAKEKNPFINVVLMAFVDEEKIADYAAGGVPPEVALHKKIATHYDLPFINLAKEVSDRIGAGEFSWEKDFIDLHPSPFGHRLYARTITEMLSKCASAASASKLVPGKLPGPLDRFNYDFGRYLPVGEAQDLRGFSLESSWHARDNKTTRKGYVNVPMLLADTPGSSFELSFDGDAVGIAVVSGPDAGIIRYSVDGEPETTVDLFTKWSHQLHLPWYLILRDGLAPGKHTLKVTASASANELSSGNACRVVWFLVNK